MEEDDLDLMEENAGSLLEGGLSRLHRRSRPVRTSEQDADMLKDEVESSDDDLGNNDPDLSHNHDIRRIWDDDRPGGRGEEEDMDDMENFIEYEDEDNNGEVMSGVGRREGKGDEHNAVKRRRKIVGYRPELEGIDAR